MYFLKVLQCMFSKPNLVDRGRKKLLYEMLPMFKRCCSTGPKESRLRLWKNIGYVSGAAAGVGMCLFFYRSQIAGREPEKDFITNVESVPKEYRDAIIKLRQLMERLKVEVGAPGLVFGVSIDGKTVWEEGFGYSDVENSVPCTPDTVMRIASISKTITMAAVAKLWENGKLDLDKPVQHYVPDFPSKSFNGSPVEITLRHLVSHLGGIRHYYQSSPSEKKESDNERIAGEFQQKEVLIKDKYPDVRSSLDLFKNDPLVAKPGSKYLYTTHGWTLISAIVENAAGEPFTSHIKKLFKTLGMKHTYLDEYESLIYHRSRYYSKDKYGHIVNSPYVDNSYKWAGGGFLSTVGDLLKFANSMLYSLQCKHSVNNKSSIEINRVKMQVSAVNNRKNSDHQKCIPDKEIRNCGGFLSPETVKSVWTPVAKLSETDETMYAMGWFVVPEKKECDYCNVQQFFTYHTGTAVGASSLLLVLPKHCNSKSCFDCQWSSPPKGVIVAIIINLQGVSLKKISSEIAALFDNSVSSQT